ncbi:YnfU family zinc-binding protein [Pragia fontium]|uniref:YnfU family zinc-binding protein n=1 Tax=Pragia fontium TaxID=82985 RepID=UPI000F6D0481|nr:Uncharacterised protein [Pragia fontium]
MSYLNELLKKVRERVSIVECPVCKETSKQLMSKVSQGLVLCCPHCRALFVIEHK